MSTAYKSDKKITVIDAHPITTTDMFKKRII
jgi:hypothetical protein